MTELSDVNQGLPNLSLRHPSWRACSFDQKFAEHVSMMVDAILGEYSLIEQRNRNQSPGCGEGVRAGERHEQRL